MSKFSHLVNNEEVANKDDPDNIRTSHNYCVFSYASPTSSQKCNIAALKVRGCFETEEQAQKHAALIQRHDPNFDVWVMQMWKWCPFPPSVDSSPTEMHYEQQSEKLQDLMSHINNEKTGRNLEFIERMEAITDAQTAPLLT